MTVTDRFVFSTALLIGSCIGCGLAFGVDDTVTVPKVAIDQMNANQQATEAMASERMKGERDWRARAIQLDNMVTALKGQLEEAKKVCPTPAAEPPKQ